MKYLVYVLLISAALSGPSGWAAEREYAYVELEGIAEEHSFQRQWRAYYWREDFTVMVRDDQGVRHRVISREPTPWTGRRLGTTYPKTDIDWKAKPRVKLIGVRAIDRTPAEFYGLKLDPEKTITAFILRVQPAGADGWKDYYINNWFHRWGKATDLKMLGHYANADPNYSVYGYLAGIAAPFNAEGKALLDKYGPLYNGIIHHSRVVKAENETGYALRAIHLMGRHKETLKYEVFHGDPKTLVPLDQRKPEKP